MVFSIQRFVEDYLGKRNVNDTDQYSVALANLYDEFRSGISKDDFLVRMGKIRTVLFQNNRIKDRRDFESALLARLDSKFKKKVNPGNPFPGGLKVETKRFGAKRRTIRRLLTEFKEAVESRAIDSFWNSRQKNKLKTRPEGIAQGLLAVFAKGVVGNNGLVRRELLSGIGFVDVEIQFGVVPHLIELKILSGNLAGDEQLSTYMKTEKRREGWLVLIDARRPSTKKYIPDVLSVSTGSIYVIVVDINPPIPSKKSRSSSPQS